MEAKKTADPGTELSADQASDVAGGDGGCTSTVNVGSGGVGVTTSAPTPGDAMIAIYDGAVAVTSHVIETVANATK